MIRYINTMIYN